MTLFLQLDHGVLIASLAAYVLLGAGFAAETAQVPVTLFLQLLVGLANLRGSIEAFACHGSAFVRTAKQGSVPAKVMPDV